MSKSRKLIPSKTVFERMRWDPGFATDDVIVVYADRFSGQRERAFADFAPERVPWSRVVQFRRGGLVLWDRRTRIDRVFGSGDTPADEVLGARPAPQRSARAQKVGFRAELGELRPYRYDRTRSEWVVVAESETATGKKKPDKGDGKGDGQGDSKNVSAIDVITYNVLHDLYDEGQLHSDVRTPILLEGLATSCADIIGLQEITPGVARTLLDQPWVRARYHASDGLECATVTPYGLLLLSTAPMRNLWLLRAGQRAYAMLATIDPPEREPVHVAVVHLTSDRHPRARTVRTSQLNHVLAAADELFTGAGDFLLMGDCNFGDDHVEASLPAAELADVWPMLHAGSPGFTFDPERNAIAEVNSISGRRRRLDRMFLRAARWRASAIELFTPCDGDTGMPGSDHFGLRASLVEGPADQTIDQATDQLANQPTIESQTDPQTEPQTELSTDLSGHASDEMAMARPTHHSAVVLLPPESAWPAIQAIRARHDRSFERWMPHINLLYGFVADAHFAAALPRIRAALSDTCPFIVELAELRSFHHRRTDTIWLRPAPRPASALIELQTTLERAFPQCDEQGKKSPAGFTPHLSIGQVRGSARRRLDDVLARWQSAWRPVRFVAGSVALISRRGDEPFVIRHIVPLGGDTLAATVDVQRLLARDVQPETMPRTLDDDAIVELIQATIQAVAGQSAEVHVVGSARLYPDSHDLDLAVIDPSPLTGAEALAALAEVLAERPEVSESRLLAGAVTPIVRARIGGRPVDIMCASGPARLDGARLDSASLGRLPDAELRVIGAVLVADWLSARTREHGPAFAKLVRALRTLTSARAIDRQALGFPGGISWALLVARALADDPHEHGLPLGERFQRVLTYLASALAADRQAHPDGLIEVLSPTPPYENTARALMPATCALVLDELERAALMCADIAERRLPWSALFAGPDIWRHSHYLTVEISARNRADLRAALGWFDGRALGFLTNIAHLPTVRPRPYPVALDARRERPHATFACGLDARHSDPEAAWQPPLADLSEHADKIQRSFARWSERPSACTCTARVDSRSDAERRLLPDVA